MLVGHFSLKITSFRLTCQFNCSIFVQERKKEEEKKVKVVERQSLIRDGRIPGRLSLGWWLGLGVAPMKQQFSNKSCPKNLLFTNSLTMFFFFIFFRRMIGAMDRTISAGCPPSRTCCARSKVSGRLWRPTQISNGWALFRRPLRRNLHRRMCWKKKRNRLLSTGCPPPKRRPFSRRNLNTFCRQTATVTSWFSIELSR